jgi:hypothetical protein
VGAAHCPAVHVALQQSLESAQACPALRQTSCEQMPAEHDMLQQSLYALQAAPPARHFPAGTGFFEPLLLAPSPLAGPSRVEPSLPASAPKPAPLPGLEAHPCPETATRGATRSNVMKAQARPKERKSGIGSPPAGLCKLYRSSKPRAARIQCGCPFRIKRLRERRGSTRHALGSRMIRHRTAAPPGKGRPSADWRDERPRITTYWQWSNGGSNPGPLHCERSALPAELLPRKRPRNIRPTASKSRPRRREANDSRRRGSGRAGPSRRSPRRAAA